MKVKHLLMGAMAAMAAALPAAAQRIPVGHLMDNSGATSDVGVPIGQVVADSLAGVKRTRNGLKGQRRRGARRGEHRQG